MSYIADVLTLTRVILAIVIAFSTAPPLTVLFLFALAELTDAFDGIFARRFPFPKGKEPSYRKITSRSDTAVDLVLGIAITVYIMRCINLTAGIVLLVGSASISLFIELLAYGRILGQSLNRRSKNCLMNTNTELAKKIVLFRRNVLYVTALATTVLILLFASNLSLSVKIVLVSFGFVASSIIWYIKTDRRESP